MSDIRILSKTERHADEKGLDAHLNEEAIRDHAKRARELVQGLHEELAEREEDLKDGLSFLDMKNDTLLSYMIDVCNIMLKKVQGKPISGHPSVERCVEYRVILEKIKAIDQRLAYQLNKIITLPDDATDEGQRIDVNNLDVQIESSEDDEDDDDDSEHKVSKKRSKRKPKVESDSDRDDDRDDDDDESGDDKPSEEDSSSDDGGVNENPHKEKPKPVGVYRPPKLRSVAYTDGKESQARRKDYSDFYNDDEADEIVDESHRREDEERTKFEEDNYTRFRDNPKRAKRKARQMKSLKKMKTGKKKKGRN